MTLRTAICLLLALPLTAGAASRVCAPDGMLKVITSLDVPRVPRDHFVRVPKTTYRQGEKNGRIEESKNSETGLHLLVVVSEPHMWVADLASRRGNYQLDQGPTYYFRAIIFGDPSIKSSFINTLEFGCESKWLLEAGGKKSKAKDPRFKDAETLEYSEGEESVVLFHRSGIPQRLELLKNNTLYVAVDYLEYSPNLKFSPSLFRRPEGIAFSGEPRR